MDNKADENPSEGPEVHSSNVTETVGQQNRQQMTISDNSDGNQLMSKRQMKRLLRNKKWLESRPEKRRQEKEKKKLKLKKLREEGIDINRTELKRQLTSMSESKCKVKVCIDCDFSDYMNDNDMKKLVKQIGRCYAVNRHSTAPVQLYITSITDKIKEHFVKSQPGYVNWDAVCTETHWTQVFDDKSKVVYLTSDSMDLIPEPKDICLSNDNVFIIGGLVDHNRHKGLCHRLAVEKSVRNGRLPIDEYISMTQRRVLAVNHVFEIMLMASNGSTDSWTQIFETVIPMRKLKQ